MASSSDESLWASASWTATPTNDDQSLTIGWQKHIPFLPGSNALQTLTIWTPGSSSPTIATPPPLPGHWLIFIHGGAWRDPAITASSFQPAAAALLLKHHNQIGSTKLAGLASLNYRLSPYPGRPSSDPAYAARHPDHISDVLHGIAFLQRAGVATGGYVLAGHSCGATLAFQAVMSPSRWGLGRLEGMITHPDVVVGLNGLYDLAGFVRSPPAGYEGLREAYEEFTRGAFGADEEVWRAVCPATAEEWVGEWKGEGEGGRRVVLVQSRGDTLVPRGQLEGMRGVLEGEGVRVGDMEAEGGHDEIWERGEGRMADILWEVLGGGGWCEG
ncbi:Alpha/Beta hydrolase protein [Cercophora newfieldiana]|uniref:Kynurenine formamidase n=1 Tax=Cercophora newfieldiana TaxID=92897 RepID=A0AA39XSH4_9PEZI|nr:Alpha/Beta hydrolase protein [Cercophora newfieldiana]